MVYSERKEWVYSNLLKVVHYPERIYVATTPERFAGPVWAALKQSGREIGPEWLLTYKRIVSFRDLREPEWASVCNQSTVHVSDPHAWADTDDSDRRRDFVRLLNLCLGEFTRTLGLCYSRELDCYYFPATPDLKPKSITYRSLQQNATREVFSVYHKKSDQSAVSHFRHSAFGASFQRFGQEWYLQVTPTYVYTVDGFRLSKYQGDLLAGIKRFDRNAAVIGQLVMWGDLLTPEAGLFGGGYPYLKFGRLERFQVDRSIDDDAWATQDNTATEQEGGETGGPSLFDDP